ncbi:MAG: hypothetical protein JWN07_3089 [Hyphomicrobiales bacterium]|nr:hypothetical protein [Hyphomicrobiales bacterium]
MSPANNLAGKLFVCVAAGALGVVAIAGLRGASPRAPEPKLAMSVKPSIVASNDELPHADLHLASQQAAFAMSHLGAMRDEAELEAREPARPALDAKARAAAARPAGRPAATVVTPPLPPVPQQAAQPERKPTTVFGVTVPSPGKLVERVSSLGESLTSLVRWR